MKHFLAIRGPTDGPVPLHVAAIEVNFGKGVHGDISQSG